MTEFLDCEIEETWINNRLKYNIYLKDSILLIGSIYTDIDFWNIVCVDQTSYKIKRTDRNSNLKRCVKILLNHQF